MRFSDKIAFMPLRYLIPITWFIVVALASIFSYAQMKKEVAVSVREDITQHVRKKFSMINKNITHAIDLGLSQEEIFKTQHMFKSKKGKVMGYVSKDAQVHILSGDQIDEVFDPYLSKDFENKNDFYMKPRQELCDLKKQEYVSWANNDVFYMFRPLGEECRLGIHFLRYSIAHEREDHLAQLLRIILFETLLLVGLLALLALFSIYILKERLSRLLALITGYRQDFKGSEEVIAGNDEFSMISKAFYGISRRMTGILDDMHTFVAVLDLNGSILFVNNTPLQISNIVFEDIKGKQLSQTYWWKHDEELPHKVDALVKRCLEGEIINEEIQIQILDSKLVWIKFSMHPVYDTDGNIEHLVAEGVDISAQKEAYSRLLTQSRKAQMGEMLSVIAHQWKQPLNVISAVTSKTMLDIELDQVGNKELTNSMEKINSTVTHLGTTMQQFTSFFNPNKKAKETSFSIIVEKCMDLLASNLQSKGIVIETQIEHNYKIESFEEELIQVVMDMLKNSADFFQENKITNPKIILTQEINKDDICLIIEDNAGGIKDEDIGQLFDIYFSTKSQEGGTGLGLHMSKMIVHEHCEGNIEVEQIEGGVRFKISLPKSPDVKNL